MADCVKKRGKRIAGKKCQFVKKHLAMPWGPLHNCTPNVRGYLTGEEKSVGVAKPGAGKSDNRIDSVREGQTGQREYEINQVDQEKHLDKVWPNALAFTQSAGKCRWREVLASVAGGSPGQSMF